MADVEVHTYFLQGRWRNRIVGGEELSEEFGSRSEAALVGRDHARELGVEHLLHEQDGTLLNRVCYSKGVRSG